MAQAPSPLAAALAQHPRLDPQAVQAVSKVESGLNPYAVGDQGSSFGYFQLHRGGALPNVANPGQWAASPAGINYALAAIDKVAGGLRGQAAVNAIVRRFERPANPDAEVARALAGYGGAGTSGGGGGVGPALLSGANPVADPRLLQVLMATRAAVGLQAPGQALQRALQERMQQVTQPAAPQAAAPSAAVTPASVTPLRLAPVGGVQVDASVAPSVAQLMAHFGVTPTSGYRDPGHNQAVGGAQNSDHLRGDAVDFSGSPAALNALYRYAQGRYPYVEPRAQSGQGHVHVSFVRP